MSAKPASAAPAKTLARYEALVAALPDVERKGATMPYTSVNGNMFTFLDKHGVVAVRLSAADRDAFVGKHGSADYVHETGTVLKEYVAVPEALLGKKEAETWFAKSLDCARTLKPKATKKKAA